MYLSEDFHETPWVLHKDIIALEKIIGKYQYIYTKSFPIHDYGPFLKEEVKLLSTISDRLGNFIAYQNMRKAFAKAKTTPRSKANRP